MRIHHLIATVFMYSLTTWSQEELIAFQGFEGNDSLWGTPTFSTPPCTIGDDNWNRVPSLGAINPREGAFFWGIQDLNGECGSSGFEWIELPTVDISGYHSVTCLLDYQVLGFDAGDDIEIEPWYDGQAQERILLVDGSNDFSTDGWTETRIRVPNRASNFKLRIYVKQNGSDQAGIDNIRLEGIPVLPCSQLMISEYVEGTSSSIHRNNFIEIYNPSEVPVSLYGYRLIKYTGAGPEPSSVLELSGTISALGTYLIEDEREILGISADLSTNSSVMDFNGDDKVGLTYDNSLIDLVGDIGDSIYFGRDLSLRRKSKVQNPNSEFDSLEWDLYGLEQVDDLNAHQSFCSGPVPEIAIYGNGKEIPDGKNRSQRDDNTYFGQLELNASEIVQYSFTIRNSGTSTLRIDGIELIGEHKGDYRLDAPADSVLGINDSLGVKVSFSPAGTGIRNAGLRILSDDPSEPSYEFLLQGEGTSYTDSPLMISTYYEGDANNRWIEITNSSDNDIPAGTYFLALFRQDVLNAPIDSRPSVKKEVPLIRAGESLKLRAILNVTQPAYALDGSEISSGVCSFNGDDVLVISTSDDEKCWENRTDIIGASYWWGSDIAYVRKYGCEQQGPHSGFNVDHWWAYAPKEIDAAEQGSSERLGEYYFGQTVFKNGTWSNGIPNLRRTAVVEDDYSVANKGGLNACNLQIGALARVTVEQGSHIAIQNDLYVSGMLEVMPGADLLMIDNSGRVENSGSILIHRSSSPMNPRDYTYWSSPVRSADLTEVFRESDPRFIFSFETSLFVDENLDGEDDSGKAWAKASGTAAPGLGYAVLAPEDLGSDRMQEVTFEGEVNNGSIDLPIALQTTQNSMNDWNLIGNPYPSALDAELLFSNPVNAGLLSATLYFWTHNTPLEYNSETGKNEYASSDYAMYTVGIGGIRASSGGATPDQFIASGQGFFVEALQEGILKFDNQMRKAGVASNFFKKSVEKEQQGSDKIWLNLYNERGAFSQVLIGFKEGATVDFDPLYDGRRFPGNAHVEFYSLLDSLELAIRGEPAFNGQKEIPLGFKVKSGQLNSLSICVDRQTGVLNDAGIYLLDHMMGVLHDLKQEPYDFSLSGMGAFNDRFTLFLGNPLLPEELAVNDHDEIVWAVEGGFLTIRTNKNDVIRGLRIFDLLGRPIVDLIPSDRIVRIPADRFASNAIYILRVLPENSNMLTSKILHLRP